MHFADRVAVLRRASRRINRLSIQRPQPTDGMRVAPVGINEFRGAVYGTQGCIR